MKRLDQATQTVFADLNQRSLDAAFDADFPANGNFHLSTIKGKKYWYYNGYDPITGSKSKKYVGPHSDSNIAERVNRFQEIKQDHQSRSEAVRLLKAAGLPTPDPLSGALLQALSKAGYFRLRGVLVGTIAFQTYPGIVGARPDRHLNTGDIDLAMDHGIAVAIDDAADGLLEAIRAVDPTFKPRAALHPTDTTALINSTGYQIDFLVTNRGADDNSGQATRLPNLGNIGAMPLRYLDFLIRNPVRSTALYEAGVAVTVPAPERYAIHKIIVATQRQNREKIPKDLGQAEFLIEVMAPYQSAQLAEAWMDAWERGSRWRDALSAGLTLLSNATQAQLRAAAERYSTIRKLDSTKFGF